MGACNHPNVLRCLGVELFDSEVWILTEWCEGGSLTDRMRSKKSAYKEEEIRSIIKQVIEGLATAISKGVICCFIVGWSKLQILECPSAARRR
jgi:serine/threonine protein kinase